MHINLLLLLVIIALTACSGSQKVKRDGFAPQVSEKFDPKGHLSSEKSFDNPASPIPDISTLSPINIAPETSVSNKLYSVSALNVPVEEVLFQLCKDAGYELTLDNQVKGKVSLNAINQPLDTILERLVSQVSGLYEIGKSSIKVTKDSPLWMSYPVNYVNLKKKSIEAIVMKMTVGAVAGATSVDNGSADTQTKVEMISENDFWESLRANLEALARNNISQTAANPATASAVNSGTNPPATAASNNAQTISNVVINRDSGLVSVYATKLHHKMIQTYLSNALERSNRQVLIEATVVEVELSDEYQAGIDWTTISGNAQASQSMTGTNFSNKPGMSVNYLDSFTNFSVSALQQFGDTKVLSSPRIMAVSNQTALLKVVDNEVYFTVEVNVETGTNGSGNLTTYQTTVHTVPVGFMMSITPFVTDNNDVSINVRPTISRIIGYRNDPNPTLSEQGIESPIPIIQEREMSTVLKLRNNQTAVIGGLIQDTHSNNRAGIPGLSSMPGIGDLFAYRDDTIKKNELVVFIKPIVVMNPDVNFGDLQTLKPFLNTETMNTTAIK
ncbi:type II secretion system protein GspD [Thiosulfativibrio zosterae]|uniref:Type II and III secretion system protein n=1 Tax=Thiosulfativibrio zosterae TaxID=2675053 RepID=A0A6F8PPW6_9GAMM|nr:type II and III secretion system protein [Thiosulfativibrio zosterae]BBP44077.1 type II and III secretion system protein [Thiosulfativibrio zosterae]